MGNRIFYHEIGSDLRKEVISDLKLRINHILPIALAIILPGLSIYSNSGLMIPERLGVIGTWVWTSTVLYVLWHVLWFTWDLKTGIKNLRVFIAFVLLTGLVVGILYTFVEETREMFKVTMFLRLALASVLLIAVQYALKAQENMSSLMLEKEQAQTENFKAQLKALRAKIDPHFLFNSLNTLRSMVRQGHGNSEQFIMSLSDFYRHTLKYDENTTLRLSEELAVLESYLFLMKSRNEEAVKIDIRIDDALNQYYLPTLALQVVVENCFKHNMMTSKMPLHIEICSTDDFYILVRNNIQPKIGDNSSSGFGLDMLKKRYELMNVNNGVVIEKSESQYVTKLKLV